MKRLLAPTIPLLWALAVPSGAAPYFQFPSSATPPAAPAAPERIVRQGVHSLASFLAGTAAPEPARVRSFLERELAAHFDFRTMGRWAAGRHYRGLTQAQKDRFARRLRAMFLDAVARNLGSYARPFPHISVFAVRAGYRPDERLVRTRVTPRGGYPIQMDFRFYRTPNGWKIFDVSANGASAVAYYRRYFANRVSRYGPRALYE